MSMNDMRARRTLKYENRFLLYIKKYYIEEMKSHFIIAVTYDEMSYCSKIIINNVENIVNDTVCEKRA